jgi:pyruvate-ferredoxin/flavodoxin oxidoreductase
MIHKMEILDKEIQNWNFFLDSIPDTDPSLFNRETVKGSQFLRPLFEFSGACVGCGETPYVKLLTQLYGDHLMIANATGCSSIYGGNLPTTPYTFRSDGRGPVWSNSLFEDNAEFGLGMRLNVDKKNEIALELVVELLNEPSTSSEVKEVLETIKSQDQSEQEGIEAQRTNVAKLKSLLQNSTNSRVRHLISVADNLTKRSVWIVGGDGWAYDIGYGGLDHVIASGQNVNILVVDTEVYSNTGGQMSKSTPLGAVAQFAASGKRLAKKDLGMMAMAYGNVYVAQIAMGYSSVQTIKAFREAESYHGPSLLIALSHCIAWGTDMALGMEAQRKAVESGHTILYRYNPDLKKEGKNPLQLDSKEPSVTIAEYIANENRYKILKKTNPEIAEDLAKAHQEHASKLFKKYSNLAKLEDW